MINIIFDGNYLMYKTFSIFRGFGKDQKKPQDAIGAPEDKAKFIRKVVTDLVYTLDKLPKGGKCIIAMDDRSWRKDFFTPERDDWKGVGYKGSRVKDPEEDWTPFFETVTSILAILEERGFIISKVKGAEGDDLAYEWSNYLRNIGESSIVISGDKDITQVVKGISEPFVVCYNNNSKKLSLYTEPAWSFNWLESSTSKSINLFDFDSDISESESKKIMESLVSSAEVKEIHSDEVVLEKILSGDDGDDVPSVWHVPNSKGTGFVRITGKKTEKIMDEIKNNYPNKRLKDLWYNDREFKSFVAGLILRTLNSVDGESERVPVIQNLERNAKLVWLDNSFIPEYLTEDMVSHIRGKIVNSEILPNITKESILEDTDFSFNKHLNDSVPSQYNPNI